MAVQMPSPDQSAILVHSAAGQQGPMTRRDLKAKVDAGEFKSSIHFWYKGMDGWKKISDVPSLFEWDEPTDPAIASPLADQDPATLHKEVAKGSAEDDALDEVFGKLVRSSWEYVLDHEFASSIDEVFLGALITVGVDSGLSLIDISSDGTNHYLRFERLDDKSRLVIRMTHLTGTLTTSKILGHRATVVVGYGERVPSMQKVWKALQAEMKSSFLSPEPGTITVDGDLSSGYVYCQVELILDLNDYISRDYEINYGSLTHHISATQNALRKYLTGRFK